MPAEVTGGLDKISSGRIDLLAGLECEPYLTLSMVANIPGFPLAKTNIPP